jgi:hypothetical protein
MYPRWVEAHPSHVIKTNFQFDAMGLMGGANNFKVDGFEHHVTRDGVVSVLVHNQAEEIKVTSQKE